MRNLFINERMIIIVLAILLGLTLIFHFKSKITSNKKFENQLKLTEALTDTIDVYKLKNGELVEEKRSIQGDYNKILGDKIILTASQKALLEKVKSLNKERKRESEIFAAAQIKYKIFIDSLNIVIGNVSSVDTINNNLSFIEKGNDKHFTYNIDIIGVRPYPTDSKPKISFKEIDFPNTQTVTFNFDKTKRKDYPVSFSVINTNPYFKSENIESYAIQGLQKNQVNPSTWNKAWSWIKSNCKYILVGGTGYALGRL